MRSAERELVGKFVTQQGRVERFVSTEGWVLPAKVELRDGELIYSFSPPFRRPKQRAKMLIQFLNLADNNAILAYARTWGALRVRCPADPGTGEPRATDTASLDGVFDRILHVSEGVEEWERWSDDTVRILGLAAKIQSPACGDAVAVAAMKKLRGEVLTFINQMLFAAGVRPQLLFEDDRWAIRMKVDCVLGALACLLMLLIAAREGLGICASCGAIFETQGKRKVYCGGCGLEAAQRAASKKLYDIKVKARRMSEQGISVREIASELERPVGRVERWLGLGDQKHTGRRRGTHGKEARSK